jgi:hypothetical protein
MIPTQDDSPELVHGVNAIAKVLNVTERQARQLLDKKQVPGAFKFNWKWSLHVPTCALTSPPVLVRAPRSSRPPDDHQKHERRPGEGRRSLNSCPSVPRCARFLYHRLTRRSTGAAGQGR